MPPRRKEGAVRGMSAFGLAVFWGACLLFLVQPLMARFILPWFGGGPAVWTTCMLFFQVLLLGGYAYAHASTRLLSPRRQVILHMVLLAAAVALLPITPGDHWKPVDGTHPTGHILLLLLACMGLPYLVLAATGPLLQAWFALSHPGVAPYRLYALSNVGSLLALLAYPLVIEPRMARQMQAAGWSVGLVAFAVLACGCGAIVWRRAVAGGSVHPAAGGTVPVGETPRPAVRLLWAALPACGVVLLLAVTNKLCQEIAVVPFLWVLPLGLYLLTFILSFDSPRWYRRWVWLPALVAALAAVVWALHTSDDTPDLFAEGALYLGTLFVACMVCHGEVHRLRPDAGRLTGFYLSISAGGACGGVFVAVAAPRLFPAYFELHVGLFLLAALVLLVLGCDPASPVRGGRPRWAWALLLLAVSAVGGALGVEAWASLDDAKEITRSFYGVLKVTESHPDDPDMHQLTLLHGGTTHGMQFMSPGRRDTPTTYYTGSSGVGRLMQSHRAGSGRRIGVVGLGVGTLAAWGGARDHIRFYEINSDVVRLARGTFHFLADSDAGTEIVPGDARLSMEREPGQAYDILVLDAFNSDSIPVHLLTLEAFATYRRHLRGDGVIAVHISNRYLDLEPVVVSAAERLGLSAAVFSDGDEWAEEYWDMDGTFESDWVLLSADPASLRGRALDGAGREPAEVPAGGLPWTDERSDLFRVLSAGEDSWLGRLQRL